MQSGGKRGSIESSFILSTFLKILVYFYFHYFAINHWLSTVDSLQDDPKGANSEKPIANSKKFS